MSLRVADACAPGEPSPAFPIGLLRLVCRWPKLAITALILSLGSLAYFLNTIKDVLTQDSTGLDRLLLQRAHLLAQSSDGEWLTPAARFLSLLGNWQAIIPIAVLLLVLSLRRVVPWERFLLYATACAGTGLWVLFFKYLLNRPRPQLVPALEEAPFASFPSGHSAYATVAYGLLVYWLARSGAPGWLRWGALVMAAVLVFFIGASRVYLATHYPSDVAAGYFLGTCWLCVMILAAEYRRDSTRPTPPGETNKPS